MFFNQESVSRSVEKILLLLVNSNEAFILVNSGFTDGSLNTKV